MATLTDAVDVQSTTPNPDFEPDEEWKTNLRQHIEDSLKPAVERLKREFDGKFKGLSPSDKPGAQTDYDNAIYDLRRTANEQYRQLLERERQERRLAAGEEIDEKWSEIFMREQQALLDAYKKEALAKANQPEATRDEERSQPAPSAEAPGRASLPLESIATGRT